MTNKPKKVKYTDLFLGSKRVFCHPPPSPTCYMRMTSNQKVTDLQSCSQYVRMVGKTKFRPLSLKRRPPELQEPCSISWPIFLPPSFQGFLPLSSKFSSLLSWSFPPSLLPSFPPSFLPSCPPFFFPSFSFLLPSKFSSLPPSLKFPSLRTN